MAKIIVVESLQAATLHNAGKLSSLISGFFPVLEFNPMIEIRTGMTVECIKECGICLTVALYGGRVPVVGQRYIVAMFQNCHDGEPGIHLVEIKNPKCHCFGGPQPFPLLHFKPLIEDKKKTGAEMIDEIIRKAKTPVDPVKLPAVDIPLEVV